MNIHRLCLIQFLIPSIWGALSSCWMSRSNSASRLLMVALGWRKQHPSLLHAWHQSKLGPPHQQKYLCTHRPIPQWATPCRMPWFGPLPWTPQGLLLTTLSCDLWLPGMLASALWCTFSPQPLVVMNGPFLLSISMANSPFGGACPSSRYGFSISY